MTEPEDWPSGSVRTNPPLVSCPTGFEGSTTTLPLSRSACWAIRSSSVSSQTANTTTSASVIAFSTEVALASSPNSLASAVAFGSSRAARTTRSPPSTRCRATDLPMLPTPMIAVVMCFLLGDSTRAMRLDLDLEVDLLAHQEPARLDRHVPGHPPVLAIDRRLRGRSEHRLPLHVRSPPEELPREGDRSRDVLDREVAVELEGRASRRPH